jgi:hypothetical protein
VTTTRRGSFDGVDGGDGATLGDPSWATDDFTTRTVVGVAPRPPRFGVQLNSDMRLHVRFAC